MLRRMSLPTWRVACVLGMLAAATLAGCSSPSPPASSAPASSAPASAQTPSPSSDDVTRLLFLGNSHTARHDVPDTVARLIRGSRPGAEVVAVLGPGSMHLDERGDDAKTLASVTAQPWDFVVLQAQNYSLSGCCDYPTTGAETLVRLAREQGVVPVLYAEWARRGIDETELILATYQRITEDQPACLPPVPEAFDIALRRYPGLVLHAEDGNHSSAAGAFLASAVLASAISGRPAAAMPVLGSVDVPPAVQARLRGVADDAMAALPAARAC
jgi:hypothetical protein